MNDPLPCLFGLLACASIARRVPKPPAVHLLSFRPCQMSLSLSLIRALAISFRAHLNNPGQDRSLSYSYKDPFSK